MSKTGTQIRQHEHNAAYEEKAKEAEVAECKKNISEKQMLDAAYKDRDTRDFYQALKDKIQSAPKVLAS
jgi:hypothetical protein